MSRDAFVSTVWADGEHRFRLAIGEIRELEEARNCGTQWLYEKVAFNQHEGWRADDLRETIRISLIGAGMKPPKAHALCVRYIDPVFDEGLLEVRRIAQLILARALVGSREEPVGNGSAAEGQSESSSAESSLSPQSMAPAL